MKPEFTIEQAKQIGDQIKINWSKIDIEQLRMGLAVELEHGTHNAITNVTNNDPILTGKIALAHLNEIPDYYTRLRKMERKGERYWARIHSMLDNEGLSVSELVEIRDAIRGWKNKIEFVKSEIAQMRQQIAGVDFSEMKNRFAIRADSFERVFRNEISKFEVLDCEIARLEKMIKGNGYNTKRTKRRMLRAKAEISKTSDSYFEYWTRISKEFHDFISKLHCRSHIPYKEL